MPAQDQANEDFGKVVQEKGKRKVVKQPKQLGQTEILEEVETFKEPVDEKVKGKLGEQDVSSSLAVDSSDTMESTAELGIQEVLEGKPTVETTPLKKSRAQKKAIESGVS